MATIEWINWTPADIIYPLTPNWGSNYFCKGGKQVLLLWDDYQWQHKINSKMITTLDKDAHRFFNFHSLFSGSPTWLCIPIYPWFGTVRSNVVHAHVQGIGLIYGIQIHSHLCYSQIKMGYQSFINWVPQHHPGQLMTTGFSWQRLGKMFEVNRQYVWSF